MANILNTPQRNSMNIQELRLKRLQRDETLKKNTTPIKRCVFGTPYGHVELSEKTESRLDAINPRWREPLPYAYSNSRVKEVFDEIIKAAMLECERDSVLEVY